MISVLVGARLTRSRPHRRCHRPALSVSQRGRHSSVGSSSLRTNSSGPCLNSGSIGVL
jgi:hypothetical protein